MTEARLVLGPILRGVGIAEAILWVETDRACEVEVLGVRERTFHVEGHHYALVHVTGLEPGCTHPYEVRLDGRVVWPDDGTRLPPSTIRTWRPGTPYRLLTGSCRQSAPHRPPWTLPRFRSERGIGPDTLVAWARSIAEGGARPDALLLLGDQVYADETNPATAQALDERRGRTPRDGWPEVASFEEYTWLYQDAWSAPLVRWLLSNLPVTMIFDDHDVIDDWNTSAAWRDQIEQRPWWTGRIRGALMSYWLYQHLGNAWPIDPKDRDLLARLRAADDGGPTLRAFAERADAGTAGNVGHRWSFRRDLGPCRLLVVDSRNGRVLEEGRRGMLDEAEWRWLEENATGGIDHLLIGSSLPWLLPRPIHDLEAWDEEVAGGAWGPRAAKAGEWLRQRLDLEHWAAFGRSFHALADVLRSVGRGERGAPPATILVLSGDVHFSYVAEPRLERLESRIRQVVTSPIRQSVPLRERRAQRLLMIPPLSLLARLLVLTTPRARARFRWRMTGRVHFRNAMALLTFAGRSARLEVDRAVHSEEDPMLERVDARDL